jgi:hypothetical protein
MQVIPDVAPLTRFKLTALRARGNQVAQISAGKNVVCASLTGISA